MNADWADGRGFCKPRIDPEYIDLAFAFTGRLLDQATGLQNNLNRWYDASVGRWLSEDPIGFNAGDANLYRYVGNGPTNGADPSGLDRQVVQIGIHTFLRTEIDGKTIELHFSILGYSKTGHSGGGTVLYDFYSTPAEDQALVDAWDQKWFPYIPLTYDCYSASILNIGTGMGIGIGAPPRPPKPPQGGGWSNPDGGGGF
jgi:RHS repeat-associated protein